MLPFGRTVTLGDALEAIDLRKAAPDPDIEAADDDDEFEATPPAATTAPTPPTGPPAALSPTTGDEDPDSFAQLAGKVATTVGVSLLEGLHRRRGVEPNELDESDREQLEQQTTVAVRRGLGDRPIPWWAPVVSAWGMAYFSMGNGARRIRPAAADQLEVDPPAPAAPETPPASSPPPAFRTPVRPPAMKPPSLSSPTRAA